MSQDKDLEENISNALESMYPGFRYRKHQKETIIKIIKAVAFSDKKYIILSAGTGSGKSVVARHVSEFLKILKGLETLFLTKTISLQNQYIEDFPEVKKLMGATNYACNVDFPVPIPPSEKHHSGCKYDKSSQLCEYNEQRTIYNKSKLKILNYAFFLVGMNRYITNGLLVVDEAHNFEESILNSLNIELDILKLESENTGNIVLSNYLPDYAQVRRLDESILRKVLDFLEDSCRVLADSIEEVNNTISNCSGDSKQILKLLETRLEPLEKKLNKFIALGQPISVCLDDDIRKWCIENISEKDEIKFKLKPVFLPKYLSQIIFNEPYKILFMSATAERVKESLKLEDKDIEYISVPYIFPLENRPIYALTMLPNLNASSHKDVFPSYIEACDDLISEYSEDTNILIHCASYKNAELIKQLSKYSKRMIIPDREQLRDIKSVAGNGNILVSPAMLEGINLADGLAKVQIFIKIPYAYLGDKWVESKKDQDSGWYSYSAMLSIIQGSGRGIRSETDKCDTFILDPSFGRLFDQTKSKVPEWFKSTINFL